MHVCLCVHCGYAPDSGEPFIVSDSFHRATMRAFKIVAIITIVFQISIYGNCFFIYLHSPDGSMDLELLSLLKAVLEEILRETFNIELPHCPKCLEYAAYSSLLVVAVNVVMIPFVIAKMYYGRCGVFPQGVLGLLSVPMVIVAGLFLMNSFQWSKLTRHLHAAQMTPAVQKVLAHSPYFVNGTPSTLNTSKFTEVGRYFNYVQNTNECCGAGNNSYVEARFPSRYGIPHPYSCCVLKQSPPVNPYDI